ncbi:hypothetical protein HRbin09_02146 [bacterium HR09]|nr:hypothetical protein HRbin09_02146 [bacterium HR09]
MSIGTPELALMVLLALEGFIFFRRRSHRPSWVVTVLVVAFCLVSLAISQLFPERRVLAVGFLLAAIATGLVGGFLRFSPGQTQKQ